MSDSNDLHAVMEMMEAEGLDKTMAYHYLDGLELGLRGGGPFAARKEAVWALGAIADEAMGFTRNHRAARLAAWVLLNRGWF
jgi:hypothetical protein